MIFLFVGDAVICWPRRIIQQHTGLEWESGEGGNLIVSKFMLRNEDMSRSYKQFGFSYLPMYVTSGLSNNRKCYLCIETDTSTGTLTNKERERSMWFPCAVEPSLDSEARLMGF